jgi:hypothetical protein
MSIRVWVSAGTVGGYRISWYDKPIGRSSGRMGLSRNDLQEEETRRNVSSVGNQRSIEVGQGGFVETPQAQMTSRQMAGFLPGVVASGECTLLEPRPNSKERTLTFMIIMRLVDPRSS